MNLSRTIPILWMFLIPSLPMASDWQIVPGTMQTRWAAAVDPANAWPEYPRPQMVRPSWQNLNGLWDYTITGRDDLTPRHYTGKILVPYPVESALSGVKQQLQPDQLLWYRRMIQVGEMPAGERVLLHFGAVDYEAVVFVNERRQTVHRGGYQSFTVDITEALQPGDNELIVRVFDPTNTGPNPHGKQNLNAKWAFYSASSGIWQTVWIERVPPTYIEGVKLTPDVDRGEVSVDVALKGEAVGYSLEAIALSGGKAVGRQEGRGLASLKIAIAQPHLWSPDDPHLYDLQVRLLHNGRTIDTVTSYFGMRKIEVRQDEKGTARIYLNNRPAYNLTVVDQGFWPDGLYTAPSDEALKFDIQAAKALGFNAIRKHIKVEPQRWYYHCDQLGLMVWQDLPSGNNDTPESRAQFEHEMEVDLAQLHSHPSIIMWVLFNEGWGAYDQERLAQRLMQADPSRILNGHSGPFDQLRLSKWLRLAEAPRQLAALGGPAFTPDAQSAQFRKSIQALENGSLGNVIDLHAYPQLDMYAASEKVGSVVGEYGSYGVYVEGHVWNELGPLGLGVGATDITPPQMFKTYAESITTLQQYRGRGLSASAYFQTFDVETEQQGFITYDREIAKVPIAKIERLNARVVPRAKNYSTALKGFSVRSLEWIPESQRYAALVAGFNKGQRDMEFLRRLALMAIRQKDQARATEVGNLYVTNAPKPYTREVWATILALTRTVSDQGWQLLRANAEEVNEMLGPHKAQQKMLEVIANERIVPYFKQSPRPQSWQDLEQSVAADYGPLGREAVIGAWMMDAFATRDWNNFGALYARYFETTLPHSSYPLFSLSYAILQNVNDPKILDAAIRVMRWRLDVPRESPTLGRYDALELDTYANLLYKVDRVGEALEWQERAAVLAQGRDPDIVTNLAKMKRRLYEGTEST